MTQTNLDLTQIQPHNANAICAFAYLLLAEVLPDWMNNCPLVSGWCRYNGRVFFADLNYEESEKAQKPIFDLAYCATKAMNNIYLLRREWDAKKFCRWSNNSNW